MYTPILTDAIISHFMSLHRLIFPVALELILYTKDRKEEFKQKEKLGDEAIQNMKLCEIMSTIKIDVCTA